MKKFVRQIIAGKDVKITISIIFAVFAVVVLGCGGSKNAKPIPSAYFGDWKGNDGSTLSIRGDGSGDFRSGSFKVENGSVTIDDDKKELSVAFFGIGKTLKIDQEPTGDQMKLGGVSYTKGSGSTTTTTSTSSGNSTSNSTNPFDSSSSNTSTANTSTTSNKSKSSGDAPPDSEVQSLVQDSIQEFASGVESEDFADFRATTSKQFQAEYTADRIKQAFSSFIPVKDKAVPLLRSTANMTPSYSPAASVNSERGFKTLTVGGTYSTSPSTTYFNFKYQYESGEWKISQIEIRFK